MFVTDHDHQRYGPHFRDMILMVERATKKSTGDMFKSIQVSAASFSIFAAELCEGRVHLNSTGNHGWNVSAYCGGEWLVKFLCLIPIHLALATDNRFVPLKDGVYSPDLERSLFQSYMASKVCIVALNNLTVHLLKVPIVARQGGVLNGGAFGGEEFCIESSRRYVVCWIGNVDDGGSVDVGYAN